MIQPDLPADYPTISAHYERPAYAWRRRGPFSYLHMLDHRTDLGGVLVRPVSRRVSSYDISISGNTEMAAAG